jgi:hypothetical protein
MCIKIGSGTATPEIHLKQQRELLAAQYHNTSPNQH